jgi:hypothetical protein
MGEREIFSIEQYQQWALPVLYTLVNPTQRPKTATDLNAAKVSKSFKNATFLASFDR